MNLRRRRGQRVERRTPGPEARVFYDFHIPFSFATTGKNQGNIHAKLYITNHYLNLKSIFWTVLKIWRGRKAGRKAGWIKRRLYLSTFGSIKKAFLLMNTFFLQIKHFIFYLLFLRPKFWSQPYEITFRSAYLLMECFVARDRISLLASLLWAVMLSLVNNTKITNLLLYLLNWTQVLRSRNRI